jgi:hypothetical protein
MKKILLFILSLMTISGYADNNQMNVWLNRLDRTISRSPEYVAQREQDITLLRQELQVAHTDEARYETCFKLYEAYKPFVNDSSIFYLKQCIDIAGSQGHVNLVNQCSSLLSLRCSGTGMYDEAIAILNGINPVTVGKSEMGYYYYAYYNLYGQLAYYTHVNEMKTNYYMKMGHYFGLAVNHLNSNDNTFFLCRENDRLNNGDLKASMNINNAWLRNVKKGSHPYALVSLYRYLEYKAQKDTLNMMYWLTESVKTDVENGVMDMGSMWELANQLMLRGDIDRAYRYVLFLSDCTNRFGSRQRTWQIAPLISDIASKYKKDSEKNFKRVIVTSSIISVLALLLLILLYYVNRQRHRLACTRDDLAKSNSQLSDLNERLRMVNDQLKISNSELFAINGKLGEANRVKDEYVGRFMSLCSIYIDKLNTMRKRVNRLVKNKQYGELYDQTRSQDSMDKEINELYENFDSAFLHLFPTFVDDFNALLLPEYRIVLERKNQLTTLIRVYALLRLGITESKKIAEFLHYSVNTIYNYRTKTKKWAIGDHEAFEKDVMAIATTGVENVNEGEEDKV